MKQKLFTLLTLSLLALGQVWGAEVTDVIDYSVTSSLIGSTASNQWATLTITGTNSGAEYKLYTMGGLTTDVGVRWNKNGYLYATASGGTLKSVKIYGAAKAIDVYGSTTAYSEKATATKDGSVTGSDSGANYDLETTTYTYVGLNGTTSSTTIKKIEITWSTSGSENMCVYLAPKVIPPACQFR